MSEEKEKSFFDKTKDGVSDYLKDKFSSPFWVTFIVAWLVCNWKFWYVTFFIEEKILLARYGILKIDYIKSFYNWNPFSFDFWFYRDLFFPYLITYFVIYKLPRVTRNFYEQSLENKNDEVLIAKKKKDELLEIEKAIKEKEKTIIDIESDIKKTEKENKTQEDIWDEDYKNFNNLVIFKDFGIVIHWVNNSDIFDYVEVYANYKDLVEYCIADKLIKVDRYEEKTPLGAVTRKKILRFTEKGNYFSLKFKKEELEQKQLKEKQKKSEARKKLGSL